MKIRSAKATKILETLEHLKDAKKTDSTFMQVAESIADKVEFYDNCLSSWDVAGDKFSTSEVEMGRECCRAGLDMAESIVNDIRIAFAK